MGKHWNKLEITCPCCGNVQEAMDCREFSEEDDLYMFTGGVVTAIKCSECGEMIEITDDMFATGAIRICEPEKYFEFLRKTLPDALMKKYNAPDRESYRWGRVTTAEWYGRFLHRLLLQFPDKKELREYQSLVSSVMFQGTKILTKQELPLGTRVTSRDMIHYPSLLEKIYLPDGLEEIGPETFQGCTGLTDVFIPRSVRVIGKGAFQGCTRLTSVRTPDNLRIIGDDAFSGTHLRKFFFPDGLEEIGTGSFSRTDLKEVHIPASCRNVGAGAFRSCDSLETVFLPRHIQNWTDWLDEAELIGPRDALSTEETQETRIGYGVISTQYVDDYGWDVDRVERVELLVNFVNPKRFPAKREKHFLYKWAEPTLWELCRDLCETEPGTFHPADNSGLKCAAILNVRVPDMEHVRDEQFLEDAAKLYMRLMDYAKDKGYRAISFPLWSWGSNYDLERMYYERVLRTVMFYLSKQPGTFTRLLWYRGYDGFYHSADVERFNNVLWRLWRRIELFWV